MEIAEIRSEKVKRRGSRAMYMSQFVGLFLKDVPNRLKEMGMEYIHEVLHAVL